MSDDPESALKKELREMSGAQALDSFVIRIGGLPIDVEMTSGSSSSVTPRSGRGRKMIDAFAKLARALPPVERAPGRHASDALATPTMWLGILGGIAFMLSFPFFFGVTGHELCPSDDISFGEAARCGSVGFLGLLVGGLFGWLAVSIARPWIRARHGGTSSFSGRIQAFLVALFFLVASTVGSFAAFGASRIWAR